MHCSILIANYNNGVFFKDCLDSLQKQTYSNWEAIVVDDGSTDNSVELIKESIADDSRFKLFLNSSNMGCGYTKNRCAAVATGEILGFLDPDDTLEPNALQIMVEAHQKYPQAALITSRYYFVDPFLQKQTISPYGEYVPKGHSFLTYGKGALTAFATFKKKFYERSEGISISLKRAVDQDLYYKMEETGSHHFIDKPLYNYRIHKNSISANENIYKASYWHLKVKKAAFNRRKKQHLQLPNLSRQQINREASAYFISRYERIKKTGSYCDKVYLLLKAILASRNHYFMFKIKSLILVLLGRV